MSLTFFPGEFVVIAGVSGGGKSTLINALNGKHRPTGKVLINGHSLYDHLDSIRMKIGYVPQDDIVHLDLTVLEAIRYASRLRLPHASEAYRKGRVMQLMEELHLSHRKNTPIRKLSGGQRKRVSIAVELISDPKLFFLDEATSGLDPGTEHEIMLILRGLADRGSTVALITHATQNVVIADLVCFLAKGGRLAYFGSSSQINAYFKTRSFDDIYKVLEKQLSPQEWEARFHTSDTYEKYIVKRQETIPKNQDFPTAREPSYFHQWRTLCHRNSRILIRNKLNLALIVFVAPFLGSLNFALWKSDIFSRKTGDAAQAIQMLFVAVIMSVMAGSLSMMQEIAKEKAIYQRERSAGQGLTPYLMSKLFLATLLALYQSAVLLLFMYLSVTMPEDTFTVSYMYLSMFLASLASMVLGLTVSAIAPNQNVTPLLTILVLIPQVIFGGGILPVQDLNTVGRLINQVTITKYPFEALVTLSQLGKEVASDACWSRTDQARESLTPDQIKACHCYGEEVFTKCEFPGLGKIDRTEKPPVDLLKFHLVIQSVYDKYKDIFSVNLVDNFIAMTGLIFGMIVLIFILMFARGY
ncbi:MAG: ATP-binding cassette domain-containing protein [Gloeomargaritaceae cyanobacterium C42_A2020_066]|nr:ATP-binding cassette domain-containing protein [Gloeomargaritaceae cyanobacterium C42_A2020_066]